MSLNRYTFWNTIEKFASRLSQVNSRTSWPPTRTLPALTSQKRAMRFAMVVLPEPDLPMMAYSFPSSKEQEIPFRAWTCWYWVR